MCQSPREGRKARSFPLPSWQHRRCPYEHKGKGARKGADRTMLLQCNEVWKMEDESCDLKWSITACTAPLGLHKKPNKSQIPSTHQLLQPPHHVPGLTAGTPPRRPCVMSRWPGVPGEQPQPPRSAQRAHVGEERSCFDMEE